MPELGRREILAGISCTLGTLKSTPMLRVRLSKVESEPCWLNVCAPFVIENAKLGIHSEIVLTSDTFGGSQGYTDDSSATEYEIYLYDKDGKNAGLNSPLLLKVGSMQTTVIPVKDLIGKESSFWGGVNIRLRPCGKAMPHVSDLFSSAFVRWITPESFDNVHANPDPVQLQDTSPYFYSMPFPPLNEYDCVLSLFNPNDQLSRGVIVTNSLASGHSRPYELPPHSSLLLDLRSGEFLPELSMTSSASKIPLTSGQISITNSPGSTKSFGYLMIRKTAQKRFSIDHPIHQGHFKPKPATIPFDEKAQFRAKNALFTPLLLNGKRFGNLTFETRFHFGTGMPLEEVQWMYPFCADSDGNATWTSIREEKLSALLPKQTERGVIKLRSGDSCILDPSKLSLPRGFSGGLGVAVSPDSTHTLFKVEIRIPEWDAFAFTHFRPGLASARKYQASKERGRLATDYITSGAKFVRIDGRIEMDELIAVMNIDDGGIEARPVLELFGSQGAIRKVFLEAIPGFACRHYLLSDLIKENMQTGMISLRLTDEKATLLMSTVHIDHALRDIALDHGSDRFSTFVDYPCR